MARKKKSAPAPPVRAQPRAQWRRQPVPDRRDGACVEQLLLARRLVGEVVPVCLGNPLRGPVDGYAWHTFVNDEFGIDYQHTGDRGGLYQRDPVEARVQLVRYVQQCLRQRGLRP